MIGLTNIGLFITGMTLMGIGLLIVGMGLIYLGIRTYEEDTWCPCCRRFTRGGSICWEHDDG